MVAMRSLRKFFGFPPVFCNRDGDLTADLRRAFVVAHNVGEHLPSSRKSVEHGADVIEIDLFSRDGRLVAGHPRRAGFLGTFLIHTIDPGLAWGQAAQAPVVKLDLKQGSTEYLRLVFDFLAGKEDKPVLIVTPRRRVIEAFEHEAPWVIRSLTAHAERIEQLQSGDDLIARLDGISCGPAVLTNHMIAWAREHGLFTMSSVINSFPEADHLLKAGVDGIITDNFAIMEVIGGRGDLSRFIRRG
jgi:glycerophosphoryl diester phosphodiesterase